MIYGIIGPTGTGKSYFAMMRVVDWLTSRPTGHVVTNLAIKMPELCEFLTREYGDTLDCINRVRLLSLSEIGDYYRHYGVGYDMDDKRLTIRGADGKVDKPLDYSVRKTAGHSCLFIIDEADEIFDAKAHGDMGHDLGYYMRHQRKFGDDVYLLAPAWEFLVKELRVMCHSVWNLENGAQMKLGKLPLIGNLFRGVPWIKASQWKVRPGGAWGGANEKDRGTERFTVDPKGIGDTYRTEDGLGVSGMGSIVRKAEKVKGLSMYWLAVPAICLCVGLWYVPKVIGSTVNKVSGSAVQALTGAGAAVAAAVVPSVPVVPVVPGAVQVAKKVSLTGVIYDPKTKSTILYLSDGSERSSTDPDFRGLLRNGSGSVTGAIIGNQYYYL